jgi:hypothetical protein
VGDKLTIRVLCKSASINNIYFLSSKDDIIHIISRINSYGDNKIKICHISTNMFDDDSEYQQNGHQYLIEGPK